VLFLKQFLALIIEYVCIEITVSVGLNLLIGNRYFSFDIKDDIKYYLDFLENRLNTSNYRVLLLGNFNAPGL
jgi:hypothetical protein